MGIHSICAAGDPEALIFMLSRSMAGRGVESRQSRAVPQHENSLFADIKNLAHRAVVWVKTPSSHYKRFREECSGENFLLNRLIERFTGVPAVYRTALSSPYSKLESLMRSCKNSRELCVRKAEVQELKNEILQYVKEKKGLDPKSKEGNAEASIIFQDMQRFLRQKYIKPLVASSDGKRVYQRG
jgi:hypothetical protein